MKIFHFKKMIQKYIKKVLLLSFMAIILISQLLFFLWVKNHNIIDNINPKDQDDVATKIEIVCYDKYDLGYQSYCEIKGVKQEAK